MATVFTETFGSYTPGHASASGMPAAGWTLSDSGDRLIIGAFGPAGSRALSSYAAAIERDVGSQDLYGSIQVTASRQLPAEYSGASTGLHGVGVQIYDMAGGYSGYFGFANDMVGDQFPGAGAYGPNDLIFFAHTLNETFDDVAVYRVAPDVYLDGVLQTFVMQFRLSSRTPTYLNADGCVRITVDALTRVSASGLYLASRGDWDTSPTAPQAWTQVYISATGYVDNIIITDDEYACTSSPAETSLPTPIIPTSQPCCSATSPTPGAGPMPLPATPDWIPSVLGGGLVPSAPDLTDSENWDW